MDQTTTMGQLKALVRQFVQEREWERFHTPKSLSMGLAVEAAELMDLFKWHTDAESMRIMRRPSIRRAAGSEVADCVIYCLGFANRTGIDISEAVKAKLKGNRRKYPVSRFKGRF